MLPSEHTLAMIRAPLVALTLALGGCGAAPTPEVPLEDEAAPTEAAVATAPSSPAADRSATRRTPRNTKLPEAEEFPMDPVTHVLKLPGPILYDTGKATLKKQSDGPLAFVKDYLDKNPGVTTLRVEGHSDDRGSAAANQALTENRAKAAAQWLIDHGVDCHRLVAVGFGEKNPIAPNATNDGRALNRRMDFVEAAFQGRPINGEPLDGGGVQVHLACP